MSQMEQRPFKHLTDKEIESRLEDIAKRTKVLSSEFVVSAQTATRPGKLNTNLVPQFQRLGEEQVGLLQELALRRAEESN